MNAYSDEIIKESLAQLRPNYIAIDELFLASTKIDGWNILIGVIAIVLCIIIMSLSLYYFMVSHKKKRANSRALITVKNIEAAFKHHKNTNRLLAEYNKLLKTIAADRSYYSHSLYGNEWLQFLDKMGHTKEFTHGQGSYLGTYYCKKSHVKPNVNKLSAIIHRWVKKVSHG